MGSRFARCYRRIRYGKPIVVVSGLPRSGTSMSMKMLEAGGLPLVVDGVRSADEDNPRGYFELERVKRLDKGGDKRWLREARGKAVKIISYLLPALPPENNYRVIFMHRNFDEILASQAKMLARRGEKSETSDERMKEIYEKHLRDVESRIASGDHFEALEVHYKDVIEDAQTQARRIRDFLGLPLDVEKMAAAVDRNLYRNRR